MSTDRRRRRWLHGIALGVAVLAAIWGAAEAAAWLVRPERLRPIAEARLSEALGAEVRIDALDFELLPVPRLEASGLRVANPPNDVAPDLLRVAEVELELVLRRLWEGVIDVRAFRLLDAELHLVQTGAGGDVPVPPVDADTLFEEPAREGFELSVRGLLVERLHLFFHGSDGATRSLEVEALVLESEGPGEPVSLASEGRVEGADFVLAGRLAPLRDWLHPKGPAPFEVRGEVFEARVAVEGTVAHPRELRGLDLAFSGDLDELHFGTWPLPRLGAVSFAGRLSDLDGSLGVRDLRLATPSGATPGLEVSGDVGDLRGLEEVALDVRARVEDLGFLAPLEVPVPEIASAVLEARLSDRDGKLGLEGRAEATSDRGVTVHVEGQVADVEALGGLDLAVRGHAPSVEALVLLRERIQGLPDFGALSLEGRLRGDLAERVALEGLRLDVGSPDQVWLRLGGSVDDVVAVRGVVLEAGFGAADAAHVARAFGRDLPDLGRLRGEARIGDADGSLGVDSFAVRTERGSALALDLSGSLQDLRDLDDIAVDTDLRAADLHVVGALVGRDLPAVGPVRFTGRVQGSDERLEARTATLRLGQSVATGSFVFSGLGSEHPSLFARLHAPRLHLPDLQALGGASEGPGFLDGLTTEEDPFAGLRRFDLDVVAAADRVTGVEGFDASDVKAEVQLHDGELAVENVHARYQGGRLEGFLRLDARDPDLDFSLRLDADGLDLERLAAELGGGNGTTGRVDLLADLRTAGRGAPDWIRELDGRVQLAIVSADLVSSYARRFVLDLSKTVFPSFRPPAAPTVGCASFDLLLERGRADVQRFLLEGSDITVTGEGSVDLVQRRYDLLLTPTTTHPGLMSVAPQVAVDGDLMEPRFTAVKRTLATSLLGGLLRNAQQAGMQIANALVSREQIIEEAHRDCARLSRSAGAGTKGPGS